MRNPSFISQARTLVFVATALAAGGVFNSARAQFGGGGRGGPRLAPEKQEAAWTIEVKCVAQELKLSDEVAGKVAELYKASRKSLQEATQKLLQDSQGDRMAMMQGMMDLRTAETAKLETALKGKLDEAQTKAAMASLGTFNPMWDLMVDTLSEFKLEAKKQTDALKAIKVYVEGSGKAQADAMASMDFQSLRDEMQKLKEKLDTDLTPILSAEQLAQWKTKTTPQRRGPGGPGGPGGPAGSGAPGAPAQPPKPPAANPPPKGDK